MMTAWPLLVLYVVIVYLLASALVGVAQGIWKGAKAARLARRYRSRLTCERCGYVEYLTFPAGDQFFCCYQRMKKEVL